MAGLSTMTTFQREIRLPIWMICEPPNQELTITASISLVKSGSLRKPGASTSPVTCVGSLLSTGCALSGADCNLLAYAYVDSKPTSPLRPPDPRISPQSLIPDSYPPGDYPAITVGKHGGDGWFDLAASSLRPGFHFVTVRLER